MAFSDFLQTFANFENFPESGELNSCSIPETPVLKPEKLIVSFQKYPGSQVFVRAFHQRCFVKIHLQGRSVANVDGSRFQMNPGDGMLVFPYQLHYIEPGGDEAQYRLLAEFSLTPPEIKMLEPLRGRPFRLDEEDMTLLSRTVDCLKKSDHTGVTYAFSEFLSRKLQKSAGGNGAENIMQDEFYQIFSYITKHLHQQLPVKALCERFHISDKTLRRMFRKNLGGMPPAGIIRNLKMHLAAEQLVYSGKRIREISDSCGFPDQFSFCRTFKKTFRCSPIQYRKNYQR